MRKNYPSILEKLVLSVAGRTITDLVIKSGPQRQRGVCEKACLPVTFKCMHVTSSTQFTPLLSSLRKNKHLDKRNALCDHLITKLLCLEARAVEGKPPTCCHTHYFLWRPQIYWSIL